MLADPALNPQPSDTITDIGVAPGGKTAQLAERMQDRGNLMAVEPHSGQIALIRAYLSEPVFMPGGLSIRRHQLASDATRKFLFESGRPGALEVVLGGQNEAHDRMHFDPGGVCCRLRLLCHGAIGILK